MIINYPAKYTDLKRFFLQILIKILHIFHQEINMKKCLDILMYDCQNV